MKKLLTLIVAMMLLTLSVFSLTACGNSDGGDSNLPEGVLAQVTFNNGENKFTRGRITNMYDDQINLADYLNIRSYNNSDGECAEFTMNSALTGARETWWIAGMHFKTEGNWATRAQLEGTKKITFDYNSNVAFPLDPYRYGFIVEIACKVWTTEGVTDADWIKVTLPFGIQNTNGQWWTASIVLDGLTQNQFNGFEKEGDAITEYAFEWMQIGLSYESDYFTANRGKKFAIDNLRFWSTLTAEEEANIPMTGTLAVQSYNKVGLDYNTGAKIAPTYA